MADTLARMAAPRFDLSQNKSLDCPNLSVVICSQAWLFALLNHAAIEGASAPIASQKGSA